MVIIMQSLFDEWVLDSILVSSQWFPMSFRHRASPRTTNCNIRPYSEWMIRLSSVRSNRENNMYMHVFKHITRTSMLIPETCLKSYADQCSQHHASTAPSQHQGTIQIFGLGPSACLTGTLLSELMIAMLPHLSITCTVIDFAVDVLPNSILD